MPEAQTVVKKEMPRYRLTTAHFIEPDYLKADTVIDYDGPPNEGMEPLNAAAEARLAEYFKKHPKASINPVEQLPLTMHATIVQEEAKLAGVRQVGRAN